MKRKRLSIFESGRPSRKKVWGPLAPRTIRPGRVQGAQAAPARRLYLEISTVSSNKAHKGSADERGHNNSNSDPGGDEALGAAYSESGNELRHDTAASLAVRRTSACVRASGCESVYIKISVRLAGAVPKWLITRPTRRCRRLRL